MMRKNSMISLLTVTALNIIIHMLKVLVINNICFLVDICFKQIKMNTPVGFAEFKYIK